MSLRRPGFEQRFFATLEELGALPRQLCFRAVNQSDQGGQERIGAQRPDAWLRSKGCEQVGYAALAHDRVARFLHGIPVGDENAEILIFER